ncbi:8590_t:CDS:2 [Paraglomus occultum]|uniref:8590_t:CDS:1 n=1 Tax=Paraglomus occultum TaxID=144539 RepID=A0A9N9A2M7_9GLOM|nr:8590_t:CDS:2 [Paraglomus occultum]
MAYLRSKFTKITNNTSGGVLSYVYQWKITNWSEVEPLVEHASPAFDADGLRWVFKYYKGRQKNPQALSLYLGILETTPGCLRGIRKKVSIIFVLENLRTRGMDFGKVELPVWFCDKHSTWGEENLIGLEEIDRFVANDTISLCVNFEIQESVIDAPPKVNNPFDRLINSPQFSDVTFRVIDECECEKLFYAHKGILACSSPVFTAMLTNGMKETYEREIRLCQINHDAFASLLRFIYTFEINIQSMADAEQLLALAERFEVVPVRDECLRYLRLELNLDNVWGVWELAEKYSCSKTSTACRDFVATHLGVLLDKSSTLHANPNILRLALENDEANVSSEEKIYELVVRWASFNISSNEVSNSTTSGPSQENNSSICMPSEPWGRLDEESVDETLDGDLRDGDSLEETDMCLSENDAEKADRYTFPRPWEGDRLSALSMLLKCVRFPIMQKGYLIDKVETNRIVMEAEGMKDLLLEAYRYHLMADGANQLLLPRTKHRRRKPRVD